jgi:hypothetical protein
MSTAPMTDEEIAIIESNLSPDFAGRIKYHDWQTDNQTAYIDLKSDQNPDKDEVPIFILECDDAGIPTFWNEPLSDFSNNTANTDASLTR